MAADQRHRSNGDRDACQRQRARPFSEANRDQHRNGDRADSRDRRDHAHPPHREAVVEQRYAHSAGRARADRPEPADDGWRFSRKKRQRERHQHQPDALGQHGGGQGRRAARGKTTEEIGRPVEHCGEQGHEESHAHPFEGRLPQRA